jgi:putative ABC transport system permease protein
MRFLVWRRHQDAQLDEEVQSHLDLAIQDRIDRGETPEHAATAARQEFGNVLLIKETVRDMWGWRPIEEFWQDLGYARRALWRAPAFTIAAVLTLSLGIGANTSMFSIVRAVVLRPLPFADPDRLVAVRELDVRSATPRPVSVSWPNFLDWRAQTRMLEAIAGHHSASFTVTGLGPSLNVRGAVVSANLFTTLGIGAAVGRTFNDDEDKPGSQVVVLSEEFRRNHLAGLANPVGSALAINGHSFTIIGIMPLRFVFPVSSPPPELWLTMAEDARVESPSDTPMTAQRGAHFIQVVGRLRSGVSVIRAQAEFEDMMAGLAKAFPADNGGRSAQVVPQLDAIVGSVKRPLFLLLAAVVCVLFIACVNLTNLMTARGVARQAELALRVALGASRSRVIRLLLAEAVALAIASAICGVAIAWWSLDLLVRMAPHEIRGLGAVSIDPAVLAYTASVAAVCALLVGLMPALRATRGELRQEIGAVRTSTGSRSQRRWLNGLIVLETALGVVLLVGATLVITGLNQLAGTNPGFDVTHVTTMRVNLPDSRYPYTKQVSFYDRLLPEIGRVPGIESVGIAGPLPLTGSRFGLSFELAGDAARGTASRPSAGFAFVSPGYFRSMRIPLTQGREFTTADTESSPRTIVISDSFARQYFPNEDPLGKRIKPGLSTTEAETPWREVVGVVGDVKQRTLNEDADPMFYVPHSQGLITTPHIVVRSRSMEAIPETVRQIVAKADPELAIYDVRTMQDRMATSMASQRFTTFLLTLFAILGLLLTAVGLYGVLAYVVTQRTHEFGVRFALGATRGDIVWTIAGGAFALVGSGLVIGIGAATALARIMKAALDFAGRPDLLTYAAVALALLAVAGVAAVAPARRALRVDPMQTLRSN